MVAIITAGILVGIQTYPQYANKNPGLKFMNNLVQYIFTVDVIVKIFQEGPYPWEYWCNIFIESIINSMLIPELDCAGLVKIGLGITLIAGWSLFVTCPLRLSEETSPLFGFFD